VRLKSADANSFTQRQVLALLNAGDKQNKIEGIVAINAFFDIRGVENQELLKQLITRAQRRVAEKFDSLRDQIKADLERPYGDLANLPVANGIANRNGIQTPPNGGVLLLAGFGPGIARIGCDSKSLKTILKSTGPKTGL
jgi:hypothetical protein